MNKKIRVGILFGGKSAEHEVSLQSAKNVIDAINKEKEESVALIPQSGGRLTNLTSDNVHTSIDVVFPILHGPFGEDGTIQGLLKLSGVPFVGAGVLGSAVGMDKDVMKRLLRDAGIPIGDFLVFKEGENIDFDAIVNKLGLPFFVKPANLGSSVGVNKVKDKQTFDVAIAEAFEYDTKILIEEFIDGRELECAVLGNQEPQASGIGEVIPTQEFYSYSAKYIDQNGAVLEIPAKIPEEVSEKVRELAIKTFKVLSCEGLGRVDVFLKKDGTVLVNEINTIPGFTKISMYPQLWAVSGVSYPELITRLIELAIERFKREQKLKSYY